MEGRWMLAATIYVDQGAAGTTQDGTTWDTAYLNLRNAITAAQSGDTIEIAGGTYLPTDGTTQPVTGPDRTLTFSLKTGVAIYGGYAGSAEPDNPDDRDIYAFETILSGDIGAAGDNTDNSYHVVTASGVDSTAILDGVTISDGNASAPAMTVPTAFSNAGGGMLVWYGSPTISNCIFDSNSAYDGGAGLMADSSSPTLTDCTFSNNTTTTGVGAGGGAGFQYSTVTLDGCTFDSNTALGGGGVSLYSTSAIFSNCTFTANTASLGGAIEKGGSSSATLTDCDFEGNSANAGGALVDYDSSAASPSILVGCQFLGNSAAQNGGAIYFQGATSASTVTNCVFVLNWVNGTGGAIYNSNASPMLTNCTFALNFAGSATAAGGGIFNSISSPALANCILWNDYGGEISNSDGFSVPIVSYTDIQGGWAGTNNVSTNPQFLRNPSAGPDGLPGTGDEDYGDLHLGPVSPVADAGNNAAVPADVTTDFDGNARFVDDPLVADTGSGTAPIVDMGAYEAPSLWPVSFDTDTQDVSETDGTVTITVQMLAPLPYDVTVPLLFSGTAQPGTDYTVPATFVTIAAGGTSASLNVQLIDNGIYEPAPTIIVDLGTLNGVVDGDITEQTITIAHDTDPPVLDPIPDQTVNYTDTLTVQAHANDPFVPGPSIEFSLDGVVPPGADITSDGLFTWTPTADQAAGLYTFTVRVSNIDDPTLFDVQSFQVQHTILPTTLSGNLFHDLNRNNQPDAGETPLAGWTVFADLNNNGGLDAGEPSTQTDATGHWAITGIMPGAIHVVTVVPSGWLTTTPVMANLPFDVPSGRTVLFSPVGFYRMFTYTGSVFQDANLNGQLDAGEVGLAGSIVWADLNNNGVADPGEPKSVIGADGAFSLANILEGPVVIRASVPSGWIVTNYPNGCTTPILAGNQQPAAINFAAVQLGTVAGAVFNDANGNGLRDANEAGFAGTTVWVDLNNNGILDSGEPSATTDASGQFTIPNVPAGTYTLRTPAQAGYVFTSPATGVVNVTRTGALPSPGNNFALRQPVGGISGTAFVDANSNGLRQATEKAFAGLTVFLDANGNGVRDPGEASAVTSATGQFAFSNVPIGSYRLVAQTPAGYRVTTNTSEVLTVSIGSSTSRNIGLAPYASVRGRVFLDKNQNGRLDVGDKALANWRVFIDTNHNGLFDAGEVSVLTDSQGYFSLNSLAAGTYVLRVVPAKGYKVGTPRSGAQVVILTAGQTWTGVNFAAVGA
jgi:predicted outer membrane repeat protein